MPKTIRNKCFPVVTTYRLRTTALNCLAILSSWVFKTIDVALCFFTVKAI